MIVALEDPEAFRGTKIYLGETSERDFVYDKEKVTSEEARAAFCGTLEGVFPNTAKAEGRARDCDFDCKGECRLEYCVEISPALPR